MLKGVFLELPTMFRASCSRIGARHGSGTRNGGRERGVDWECVSHFSCSLFQDRKFISHLTRKLFCYINPEFESTTNSKSYDFVSWCMDKSYFLLVLFNLLLRNKLFLVFQFLGNLLLDSFTFPILHTVLFYFCERDQPIDSIVVASTVGIQAPDWLHQKEENQNFSFVSVSPPRLPQLLLLCWTFIFSLHGQFSLPLKDVLGKFACLWKFAQRFSLQDTDSKRLETTVSRSHVRTSFLDASPTRNRIVIRRQFLEAGPWWTWLQHSGNCACCRVLAAARCSGMLKLRSSEAAIVASLSMCSLLTSMQKLGS